MQAQRLKYLDGVRGLAAVIVFLHHFSAGFESFVPFVPSSWWQSPLGFLLDGRAAVSLFFVLSGLVLSLQYLGPRGRDFSLREELWPFVFIRIVRICVPFVAVLAVSYVTYCLVSREIMPSFPPATDWLNGFWPAGLGFTEFLRQCFLPIPSRGSHLIPPDWSLTVELNVSFLMPFFILAAFRSLPALWFLVFLLFKNHWYYVHFALGMMISHYLGFFQNECDKRRNAFGWSCVVVGFLFYAGRIWNFYPGPRMEELEWLTTGLGAALLIVGIISAGPVARFFARPIMVYLGRISYGIYLVHFLVLKAFTPLLIFGLNVAGMDNPAVVSPAALLLSLVVVLLLADVLHRFVERPALAWGRKFLGRSFA